MRNIAGLGDSRKKELQKEEIKEKRKSWEHGKGWNNEFYLQGFLLIVKFFSTMIFTDKINSLSNLVKKEINNIILRENQLNTDILYYGNTFIYSVFFFIHSIPLYMYIYIIYMYFYIYIILYILSFILYIWFTSQHCVNHSN